jgi:endonuclease III
MSSMDRLKQRAADACPTAAKLQRLSAMTGRRFGQQVKAGRFQIVTVDGVGRKTRVTPVSDWLAAQCLEAEVDRLLAKHA